MRLSVTTGIIHRVELARAGNTCEHVDLRSV